MHSVEFIMACLSRGSSSWPLSVLQLSSSLARAAVVMAVLPVASVPYTTRFRHGAALGCQKCQSTDIDFYRRGERSHMTYIKKGC